MRAILRQSNLDLLREIEQLRAILQNRFKPMDATTLVPELAPFYEALVQACDQMHQRAVAAMSNLDFGQEDILNDVLSEIQDITRLFQIYNRHFVGPLLRHQESDRQCLKLLNWLHTQHPQTQKIPAGLSNGEFGILPAPNFPIVYSMPVSAQYGLLYLPLFFHEFGHLLYACHKQELDDLVQELQEKIAELLGPMTQRDDRYSQTETAKRNLVVETWYEWMQELFCDSVGFHIGGPSFIHAFSMYLRMRGRGEFQVRENELAYREHPITWLRIHVLADQMHRANFHDEANALEETWKAIAEMLNIQEDYFGYYDDAFLPFIYQTISDLLTETNPRHFTANEISMEIPVSSQSSPVHLLNHAWAVFLREPAQYGEWQKQIMTTWWGN
jgi:hypothetical protein